MNTAGDNVNFSVPTQINTAMSLSNTLLLDGSSEMNAATQELGSIFDSANQAYDVKSPYFWLNSENDPDPYLRSIACAHDKFAMNKVKIGKFKFRVYVFSDDSCLVSFGLKNSKMRAYVMWPFVLNRKYVGERISFDIGNKYHTFKPNSFGVAPSTANRFREKRKLFDALLINDLKNIKNAFDRSLNLGFNDIEGQLCQSADTAYPINHTIAKQSKYSSFDYLVQDIIYPYIHTVYPESKMVMVFVTGRMILPDGKVTDPEIKLKVDDIRNTLLEEKFVDILNSKFSPVPIAIQIAQTNGRITEHSSVYGPKNDRTAHESVAIVAKVQELINLSSTGPARADVA